MAQHKTIDRLAAKRNAAAAPTQPTAAEREHRVIDRRTAGQGQTVTIPAATVPAAPAQTRTGPPGGYYSPREYGAQAADYAARVTTARAAMEERGKTIGASQAEVQQLWEAAQKAAQAYQNTKGKFRGANAGQYEQQMMASWTEASKAYATRYQAFQKEMEEYRPYEDAYNAAIGEYNAYVTAERAEYDNWRGSIRGAEEIRAEQAGIKEKRAELQRLMMQSNAIADGKAAPGVQAQAAQIEARIQELQGYLGGVGEREKLLQEELGWSEHFLYEDLRGNADFGQLSGYRSGIGGLYDQVNTRSGAYHNALWDDAIVPIRDDAFAGIYWYMTDEEAAMHNYVHETQGEEAAKEYLAYLTPELNRRKNEEETGAIREWSGRSPVNAALATAGSVLLSPLSGIEGAAGMIAAKIRGEEIDPNADYGKAANWKNAAREGVTESIEQSLGKFWGPVGSFAYQTGVSMMDMLADSVAGPGAMALIGTRAFSEGTMDAKTRGLDDTQALTLGAENALAEILTERIGLDEKLGLPESWKTAGFWKGALRGAIGEGLEEGLTNLANLAADVQIAGEKSEFMRSVHAYKEQGMDDQKAVIAALKDAGISLAVDALGGAISGGIYGGIDGVRGKKKAEAQKKAEGTAPEGETVDNETAAPDNATAAPDNVTAAPDNATAATVANNAKVGAAGEGNQKAPARSTGADTADQERVSRTVEELKRAAEDHRNPAVTGVMRTAQQEDELRRIAKATTKTEVTAIDYGVSDEKIQEALRIRELTGKEIVFEGDGQEQGFWGFYDPKADEIHLAADTGDIMAATFGHELTHSIEKTASWESLRNLVARRMNETGMSWETARRQRQELYTKEGRAPKNDRQVDQEVVAHYIEKHLLTDEQAIRALVKDDRSIARRILDWLDSLWAKVAKTKGSREREFVRQAREIYRAALQEAEGIRARREVDEAIHTAAKEGDEEAVDALIDEKVDSMSFEEMAEDDFDPASDRDIPFSIGGRRARGADLKSTGVVRRDAEPVAEHEAMTEGAVVLGEDGVKYSIRSMREDIAEGQMFADLQEHCGWTQAETAALKQKLTELVEYMTPHREILDMNETYGREGRKFSPYKPNSDPLYKISMDFSTLCSKRLLTQYVIENLQLREQRPMSAEEQMAIRDMLNEYRAQEKGIQVACAMCYVEAARLKAPGQITRWMEDPESHLRDYFAKKNPEFNARVKKAQEDFKESRGYGRNTPKKEMKNRDVTELNRIGPRMRQEYQVGGREWELIKRAKALPKETYLSAGNLADLSEREPEIYAAYTTFVRNATRSKALETDEPYYYGDSRRDNGNGIVVTDGFIESVNRENGMRFSSWSDWRIQHMLDYITAVIDNSVRGAAMHGYTKFPEEVRVLGHTGMMFNMSGVAGTQTGLNPDGSLSFSETESINFEEAKKLRQQFPETAGLQCIGVGDAHITELLRSGTIDYVIPYHASGLNATMRRMADIYGWKDYTGTQHAAIDKGVKLAEAADPEHWHEEPTFSEFFVGYDTGMTGQEAMEESARRYVQMCRDRGMKPKFEKFSGKKGYWKLLIDRKMINQKTGRLIRQKPVQPNFDFDEIRAVVDRHVANYDEQLESKALAYVAQNWDTIPDRIRELKKAKKGTKAGAARKALDTLANETLAAVQKDDGIQFSIRERDGEYEKAVRSGDMQTAQRMVDEAAEERGAHAYTDEELAEIDELMGRAYMEEDAGRSRKEWKPVARSEISGKAAEHLRRTERKMAAGVAAVLDVPGQAGREFLNPIVEKLADEYLKNGTISPEIRDRLFDTAWEQGRVVDQEFYDTYKEVKDYLRTTAITISEEDRDNRDWAEFRKQSFGTLRLVNEGGLPVDTAWGELEEMAPALFNEAKIYNIWDQLRHMYEVGQSIRKVEKTLDEHYGADAGFARKMTRNDFDAAIAEGIRGLWEVQRYTEEQRAEQTAITDEEGEVLTEEEVAALYPKLKDARKALEKAQAKNLLSKRDRDQVQRLLRHDIQPEHLDPDTDNVRGILAVYEAKKLFEEVAEPIRRWNRQRKAKLYAEAEELIYAAELEGGIEDKKRGFLYSRETMERNIRDIVKDKASADKLVDTYFKPVHEAEAEATRMKNEYRRRVKELDISRKVAKGDTVSEAYAVQFVGEVYDILRLMEKSKHRLKKRDGKSYKEWQAELQKLWEENPSLDKAKIEAAAKEMGKIYEELFAAMNKTRVANGYEPVNHRSGYFPHFQQDGRDGILAQFGKAMGIDVEVQALPTSINGMTHTFKPGIRWFGNALERKTFDTAYDAVEGFDRYIEGVSSVVHQTPNIQRLRALANQIRYRTGDEGLREQIRKIQERTDLTDEQKDTLIRETASEGKFQLSNFVVELDEYTNLLANKKSRADRNMEQAMGRDMYNVIKAMESRVAANMVAINPGSWLTNFIPITQGWACVDTRHMMTGMLETLRVMMTDDGMVDRSDFLTNRQGSDPLVRTVAQEWSAKLSSPMEWIDNFTAGTLVRARYAQNLKHMSEAEAMSEADEWAAGVMADRSKGAMPTVFHRSNPITKLFTQFQLEVNNQCSYILKDIPREKRDEGKKAIAMALLRLALGAWLYNELYEKLFGRRPALDPIDMVFGFGRDVLDPELDMYDATVNLGTKIAENTPFIGGLLGGGRVPISSALPDMANLGKALLNDDWSAKKKLGAAAKELAKPAVYMLPPFGGGQIKKIWEGLKMVAQGGSYTLDADGNPLLQYPLQSSNSAVQSALEAGQAVIFGKTTIRSGREWVEGGFKNLSAEQTATYRALLALDVSQADAFALMQELRGAEKTDEQSRAQVQREILRASGLDGDALGVVYYDLMVEDNSKEKALMDELREGGADMGAVANCLMDIKDADAMYTGAKRSNAMRDSIRTSGLTDAQKQAIYSDRISDSYDERIAQFRKAGMDVDDFLTAQNEYTSIKESYEDEGDMATAFARWVNQSGYNAGQKQVIRDSLKYWRQMPANPDRYDRAIEAGLNDADAAELAEGLEALEPMEGKTSVSDVQKYRVAIDQSVSESNQLKMLQAAGMDGTTYDKVAKGHEMGVPPAAWVRVKEVALQYDADGNGNMTNAEYAAAVEGICAMGIVLPGDHSRFNLSAEQKGILWQMLVGKNTKSKNNPFSPDAGRRWRELMGYE